MNCKPGDLAYIVKPDAACHMRIVEVLHSMMPNHPDYGFVWTVKCASPLPTFGSVDRLPKGVKQVFHMPDDFLRPIGGVPAHDEQHDEVTA